MKDISTSDLENNIPLVTRKDRARQVSVGDVIIGGDDLTIMAGPCTVESKTQIIEIAHAVKEAGAQVLRGGIFKPLTFPYGDPLAQPDADSGLPATDKKKILDQVDILKAAEKRLSYFKEAADKYNLPTVSEILYADTVSLMEPYVDIFQIGYRSMFNLDLVHALCKTDKPVFIKRHYGESLRSLLGIAEHFEARGKANIILCERGVSVPHTHNVESRAILDIQAIPALNEYAPGLPVIADPSHATFKRSYIEPMACAAIAAGADGILVDVHPDPTKAWVDPLQALDFKALNRLVKKLKNIRQVVAKA